MSEKESNQASLGASDASLPAKNGSRDVEHAPTPLGSEEHSARDDGVATRTRLQTRLQTVAAAGILDPSGIAAPQTQLLRQRMRFASLRKFPVQANSSRLSFGFG